MLHCLRTQKIQTKHIVQLVLGVTPLLLLEPAWAADAGAKDLLEGTSADLVATIFGEGKKYIYLGEGLVALMGYIKTRNLMTFGGIFIVSIFLNSILAKLIS